MILFTSWLIASLLIFIFGYKYWRPVWKWMDMARAQVKPLSTNTVTGTGTLTMDSEIFGGYALNTDGTNVGTLVIRDTDAGGEILVTIKSASTIVVHAPHQPVLSKIIYYSVSGTGADAFLYEWDQVSVHR